MLSGAGNTSPRLRLFPLLLLLPLVSTLSCQPARGSKSDPDPISINTLSDAEQAAGWILLFDGKTLKGWKILDKIDAILTTHNFSHQA